MRELSRAEWAAVDAELPPGARPELADALALGFAGARAVAIEAGGWLVPLVIRRSRVGEIAEALPWGISGGPVPLAGAPAPLDAAELRSALGVAGLRIAVHPEHAGGWSGAEHVTHVLDLGATGAEAYRTRAKRHTRAAGKAGVGARVAEPVEAERVAQFLERAASAEGRHHYPRAVVEAVARAGLATLAERDGEWLSAALFLTSRAEAFYWLGGSSPAGREARASSAAMDAAIRRSAEHGLRRFDFGASEGLPGVASFKEGFGAEPVPYVLAESRAPLVAAAEVFAAWVSRTN